MVEKTTVPPGRASRAQEATSAAPSGTCSTSSHAGDEIEVFRLRFGQRLGGRRAVLDVEPRRIEVRAGGRQGLPRTHRCRERWRRARRATR